MADIDNFNDIKKEADSSDKRKNKDKTLIAIKGKQNSGKSISMKSMIYRLSKTAKNINLAIADSNNQKINKCSKKNVNNFINIPLKQFNGINSFISYSSTEFISFFNNCIRLVTTIKGKRKQIVYEIDFLAILEFENSIKVGICTIGDNEKVIDDNLCENNMTNVLRKEFRDCDVIYCAAHSYGSTVDKLRNICNNPTNSIIHHNIF